MQVRGLTTQQAIPVVASVSDDLYDGNIDVREWDNVGRSSCHFRLWATDARAWGARTSTSGRYAHAASWEAYRDVIRALFEAGARSIRTSMRTYHSLQDFEDTYRDTEYQNIGSMMYPVSMPELTV